MIIDTATKEQIRTELDKYVRHIGSQNKAAVPLKMSNAYISKMLSGDYEVISDEMWVTTARNMGMRLLDKWQHADTKPAKKLAGFFDDARMHGNVFGLVCTPGSGKTDLLDHYARQHRHVFYVKCERHMPESELLRRLLLTMGKNVTTGRVSELIEQVRIQADKHVAPVIILDEIEKVKNEVMFLFIDLYNALWKRCGIILIGTHNLRDRIETYYRRGRMGYNEILSRLGGRLIEIAPPDAKDAELVIQANGVTNPMVIADIINNSKTDQDVIDLRRVERLVHAEKQKADRAKEPKQQEIAA